MKRLPSQKNVYEDESANAQGRKDYRQIAEWLEELKQYREQNQETNLDHYKDEILECCLDKLADDLAIVKGRPKLCYKTNCDDCDLKNKPRACDKNVMDWLKQQHIKPTYKLTEFENDLLQSYPSKYKFKDIPVLDRLKGKGYFKSIDENATIGDILANSRITEED